MGKYDEEIKVDISKLIDAKGKPLGQPDGELDYMYE